MDNFAKTVCVALRVDERVRGHGLGKKFMEMGDQEAKKISPNVGIRSKSQFLPKIGISLCQVVQLKCLFSGHVPSKAVKDPLNGILAFERTVCYYKNLDLEKLCRYYIISKT